MFYSLTMKKEHTYNPLESKDFRRELRKSMTSAEVVLWQILKGRQIHGLKFRRQFGIGPYILDFYCPSLRLGIELDGQPHFSEEALAYDARRTSYLNRFHNITILRFENRKVFDCPDLILDEIIRFAKEKGKG